MLKIGAYPYQTAPTAFFDRSGKVLIELEKNTEKLLVYEFEKTGIDFGQEGVKQIADALFEKK